MIISANLLSTAPFCRSEGTVDIQCHLNIPVPELPAVISIIWADMQALLLLLRCCNNKHREDDKLFWGTITILMRRSVIWGHHVRVSWFRRPQQFAVWLIEFLLSSHFICTITRRVQTPTLAAGLHWPLRWFVCLIISRTLKAPCSFMKARWRCRVDVLGQIETERERHIQCLPWRALAYTHTMLPTYSMLISEV